ncbi:flavin reductase [Parvularcula dongshanensis]|uniref:Flavin reductase (DIM6/NTAB) family NADH-FMN oxidoreductase RutF n=1 Tax=Parvularcula dongshanensis TaxID=1173995 RepID=A0A840I2K1_9PROT|nr:flavin reductase (DIM6/NTAB) family NADH-FMN oxidoreductase RutF [Parvularcula dongshanensis]
MAGPDAHTYEPKNGHGLRHDPFNSIVAPRPIGWVSTCDGEGRANLAPYSFFNALAYTPPTIGFSSSGRKDSLENAEATGQFVWNLATRALGAAMNATAAAVAQGASEFELAGLTPAKSRLVAAPRVLESPVNFECVVTDIVRLRTKEGEDMPNWFVIGEVVMVHIDPALVATGVFETEKADPIMRGGGPTAYFALGDRIDMARPETPDGLRR